MKIIIIGNNVAGTFSAQNIRNKDENAEIHIYSQENYNYYTRIKLPEIISELKTIDDLIVFKDDWYVNNNINTHLNSIISAINPDEKFISSEEFNQKISYDKLILAVGSHPNIPPIDNTRELLGKGVFTLRNIDDAYTIRNYIKEKNCEKAIIIGGGLLGLELSKQIKNTGLDTRVIEFFPRLLPRQLDVDCANMLKKDVEDMGITVELDAKTETILGNSYVEGVKLKNGNQYDADLILIQAGVRPNIELAKVTGLDTDKGIVVNEYLETSKKDIYAVGDCIQFNNQTWGIIPACMDQSQIVASSLLGDKEKKYKGTTPKNTLKIVGIDLTSIGVYDPSEELGGGWEIMRKIDKTNNCYQKIVLKDNKLKGAILFGEKDAVSFINKNIESEVDLKEVRKAIDAYIYKCENCGAEYDEAKKDIAFEDLPDSWECPKCGSSKKNFEKIEE
ncbi:MAG: NAD(P)/FAD-dependent oxidoreductase [Promethearchaeota archaeon]|nr:MAG: NAD(P)/FAD-dependent oxidoreductase [Candidatus Lokiarchaeota archaeon]